MVVHAVAVHSMVPSTLTPGHTLEGRHATGTGHALGEGLGAPVPVGGAAAMAVQLLHPRADPASRLLPPSLTRPPL